MSLNELLESRKFFLWICGIWPEECQRKPNFSRMKLYIILFNLIMMCFLQIAGVAVIATSDSLAQFVSELSGFVSIVAKVIPFVINRNRMLALISETIRLEESSESENEKSLETVEFWRHIRNKLIKYHTRAYLFVLVIYCIQPIMLLKKKVFPLQTVIQANLFVSPWYEFFYVFHCIELCIGMSSVIATDGLYVIFICKLYEELQRIECLIVEESKMSNMEIKGRSNLLRFVIRKHCAVIVFGEKMCNLIKGAFFMQYFFISATLCFAAFMISITGSSSILIQMYFVLIMSSTPLFVISLAGELMSTRSVALSDALLQSELCCSNFGELKAPELRQVVLIQLRMQKPLTFSVGNFGINLELFAETMKRVYTIVMLLRSNYV